MIINLNLPPPKYPDREWTDPTMDNFGTVAFGFDFMRDQIFVGRREVREDGSIARVFAPVIEVGLWLNFIPECYRERVIEGVRIVGKDFINTRVAPGPPIAFITALREWIGFNVDPVMPWTLRDGGE